MQLFLHESDILKTMVMIIINSLLCLLHFTSASATFIDLMIKVFKQYFDIFGIGLSMTSWSTLEIRRITSVISEEYSQLSKIVNYFPLFLKCEFWIKFVALLEYLSWFTQYRGIEKLAKTHIPNWCKDSLGSVSYYKNFCRRVFIIFVHID